MENNSKNIGTIALNIVKGLVKGAVKIGFWSGAAAVNLFRL